MAKQSDHTAAPMILGVILQLERALFHLGQCGHGETVAVEVIDDISRHKEGREILREQDKNTVRPKKGMFSDRSMDLWRTLQIWVDDYRTSHRFCARYLLVTNASAVGSVAEALRSTSAPAERIAAILAALRGTVPLRKGKASAAEAQADVQVVIDDVLALDDALLADLVGRIELVESFDYATTRAEVASRLGISPDLDRDDVLRNLMGWVVEILRSAWADGAPGVISKESCLRQIDAVERRLVRRRLLPRPAAEIVVADAQVASARARPFVDHLGRIEVDDDEMLQAIEHFLQFNAEKHRLTNEGEIPLQEWRDRGDRLKQRWRNVARQVGRTQGEQSRVMRGQRIFADTTYYHREALAGQSCDEVYMTSGHYHRLADENAVWWDPEFKKG